MVLFYCFGIKFAYNKMQIYLAKCTSWTSYKWIHIICIFWHLAPFSQQCFWGLYMGWCISVVPVCCWIFSHCVRYPCLFILWSMDVWTSLGLLWIKLIWTLKERSFHGHTFAFLLGTYLWVEWLSHGAGVYESWLEKPAFFQSGCTNLHSHQ